MGSSKARPCSRKTLPPLPTCFDSQPAGQYQSCYRVEEVADGNSTAFCSGGDAEQGVVMQCRHGVWTPGNVIACDTPPKSAWRLVAAESTLRGWWLRELAFYSDSNCRRSLTSHGVQLEFAVGAHGPSSASPHAAFDGDVNSYWQAPCASSSSFDLCGCRGDLGQGWSHEQRRCVPGGVTDGHAADDCLSIGQNESLSHNLGCRAGKASLGVHFAAPQEIACIRMLQYDVSSLSTTAVSLEAWGSMGWQEVKRWSGLRSGTWETLPVYQDCPTFRLPQTASMYLEVIGLGTSRSHGDSLTFQCAGGGPKAEVHCNDGEWSVLRHIECSPPMMPTMGPHRVGRSAKPGAKERASLDAIITMFLWLLGAALMVVLFIGIIHLVRRWLQRRAWKQLFDVPDLPSDEHTQSPVYKVCTAAPAIGIDGVHITGPTTGTTHQVLGHAVQEAHLWLRAAQVEVQRLSLDQQTSSKSSV